MSDSAIWHQSRSISDANAFLVTDFGLLLWLWSTRTIDPRSVDALSIGTTPARKFLDGASLVAT
jgi:hypothetical protein